MAAHMVTTSDGRVAVQVQGVGPSVLLVHGIPGSARIWHVVGPALVTAGFQTITPDLLGFGDSSRPAGIERLGMAAQAAALHDVLTELRVEPVAAVGHDYGMPICVLLARRWPQLVSGLVLAAGNVFTDTPIPMPLRGVNAPLVGRLVARLIMSARSLRLMLHLGMGHPRVPLDPTGYLGDREQQRAIATIFSASLRELAERYAEVEAAVDELRVPVAVVWGERDPFFPVEQARRVHRAIPRASLSIEDGAGHFLPEERPTAFVRAIQQLQRDRDGAAGRQGTSR